MLDWALECKSLCGRDGTRMIPGGKTLDLHRPHLCCFTCILRRVHYDKVNRKDWIRSKTGYYLITPIHKSTRIPYMPIPKEATVHIVAYNMRTRFYKLKQALIHNLISLVEAIAEW